MNHVYEEKIIIPAVYYKNTYMFDLPEDKVDAIDAARADRLERIIEIATRPDFLGMECTGNFKQTLFLTHSIRPGVEYQLSRMAHDGYFTSHADLNKSDFRRNDYSCEGLREISELTHNRDLELTVIFA